MGLFLKMRFTDQHGTSDWKLDTQDGIWGIALKLGGQVEDRNFVMFFTRFLCAFRDRNEHPRKNFLF